MDPGIVIVGASLAGAKAAEALRGEGYAGSIRLIGEEIDRPYERPPLSKDYLQGKVGRDSIYVHPAGWYAANDVELILGTTVAAIDPTGHRVHLSGGEQYGYTKLLLATGSRPRRPSIPGADADGVLYLRQVGDSERIRETFGHAARVVIIGGGWIGLETAAAARMAGVQVTVLEAAQLPLVRVLGPELAQVFAELHRDHGVDLRCGVRVTEITTSHGHATGIRVDGDDPIPADAVIVGVGIAPNTSLAEAAGLSVENGIRVEAALRTSHPDIFAAGDVANAFHPLLGKPIRVEHWANALHQPAIAARSMLGRDAIYDAVPYFFTDQYDLGMEYAGYVEPGSYERVVVRGRMSDGEFIAFWLSQNRVLAGMNVNTWDVTDTIQELIRTRAPIDPERLADPATPLETLTAT